MLRIAHRSILLLLCTVMLVSLIAARPLAPQPASFQVGGAVLQDLPSAVTVHKTSAIARAYQARRPATEQALRLAEIKTMRELARATAAQPRPRAVAPAAPARIAGEGPWMRGQRVAQTARLDLYVGKRTFTADQVAALAPRIEQALRAAERRFGTTLKHRVSLGFYGVPPKKGVRGMAYTDERRAELFYRPDDDRGGAVTIAAHELGHHLEAQRYGEDMQRRADTILHEGMATWIAADRWLPMCEASSWQQRARQLHAAGVPLRLLTAERSGPDNAYELWASFVDFLVRRYGWGKLDALYQSGRGRAPGSANYQKVLGKSLEELADDWRTWVGQSSVIRYQ